MPKLCKWPSTLGAVQWNRTVVERPRIGPYWKRSSLRLLVVIVKLRKNFIKAQPSKRGAPIIIKLLSLRGSFTRWWCPSVCLSVRLFVCR